MPRHLQTDRWMFGSTVALCLVGAIMVFSASAVTARDQYGDGTHFLLRQLVWLAIGLGGMMALMNVDYRKLRRPEFIFTTVFAALVLLAGAFFLDKSHATHRWIRLGPASLQPSEFAKLAVIFYLAWFLERRRRPDSFGVNDWRHTILPALGPVLAFVGLIVIEPDLGTAVEIFIIAVAMLYVAGLNGKYIIWARARRVAHRLFADRARLLSLRARHGVPASRRRPAGPRLPAAAIADRRGLGRLHRRGPDGEQTEAFLSSRGAHGFHLCGVVRGAGIHRRRARAGACSRSTPGADCARRSRSRRFRPLCWRWESR